MPEYDFDVDLRFGEFLKFQLYMIFVRFKVGLIAGVWVLAGVYMIPRVVTGQLSLSVSTKVILIGFGLPLAFLAAIVFGGYRNFNQVVKPRLPIRYSVGAEGIATSMPSVASQIQWSGIVETKSWGGLLLLFLTRQSALIIPMRCVGQQGDEFRNYVRTRSRAGRR